MQPVICFRISSLRRPCSLLHICSFLRISLLNHLWMAFLSIQYKSVQFSSVQLLSCVRLFVTPWTAARQTSLSITDSRVHSNSCPLSRWSHPTISSSVVPFSSTLQSFPASGSFQMSQLFTIRWQSIGVSASASLLLINIQDWFPLGLIGLISLKFKGLPRVFSNTTVQNHQFFSARFLYSPTHTSVHDY